jgi:hypothetical protein
LAIDDFNRKKSALVGDLQNLFGSCTQKFSEVRLIDTRRNASHVLSQKEQWSDSCAIVGIQDNQVAKALAEEKANNNIPIVSYGAYSDVPSNGNLTLTTATFQQRMDTLVEYMELMGVARAALLYAPGEETQTYFEGLQNAAEGNNLRVFDAPSPRLHLEVTLRRLRNTFVRTIVVAWERDDDIEFLAEVAESLNMLSDQFTWIFLDSYVSPQHLNRYTTPDASSLRRLFSRAMIFQALDPFVPRVEDRYGESASDNKRAVVLKELQDRAGLVDTVNALLQENPTTSEASINVDVFDDDRRPAYGAGFLYDSVIAAGIAACQGGSDALGELDFEGVTGRYQVQDRARASGAVEFGIFVIQQQYESDGYVAALRDLTNNGKWVQQDRVDVQQQPVEELWLSKYAYILGLTLAGLAFIFCLGSAIFIYRNRKNVIVARGQPLFLYFACFGSSFFSFSIVFQSFDDSTVENEQILDIMCMLQVSRANRHELGHAFVWTFSHRFVGSKFKKRCGWPTVGKYWYIWRCSQR